MGVAGGENRRPITTQPMETLNIKYIDFFVPGILAMSLMNSGVIGLSTAFVTYREKGILRRIKVTPFSLTQLHPRADRDNADRRRARRRLILIGTRQA